MGIQTYPRTRTTRGDYHTLVYRAGAYTLAIDEKGSVVQVGTDQATVVQAACDRAGVVYIESGAWTFANVTIPSYTRIKAAGRGLTIITAPAGANTSIFRNVDPTNGNTGIIIEDLTLDHDYPNQTAGNGISFTKVTDFRISNVEVLNAKQSGIYLSESTHGTIDGCNVDTAGNDGILLINACTDISVTRSTADNCRANPINAVSAGLEVADDCARVTVSDCHFTGNEDCGIAIHNHPGSTGPFDVMVSNCIFKGNGRATNTVGAVNILAQAPNGPNRIAITNCTVIDQVLQDGYRVAFTAGLDPATTAADVANVTFVNCKTINAGRHGFNLQGTNVNAQSCHAIGSANMGFQTPSNGGRVSLNAIYALSNTQSGVQILVDNVSIVGGVIHDNGSHGIIVNGERASLQGLQIVANGRTANGGRGIDFIKGKGSVINCTIADNTRQTSGEADGVLIQGNTLSEIIIQGCWIGDTRSGASRTQRNGIRFAGVAGTTMATNCVVTDNVIPNNSVLAVSGGTAPGNKFRANVGIPDVATKTSAHTATSLDKVLLANATSAAFSITLSNGAYATEPLVIKKTDASANIVTIVGTIDGAANLLLTVQNESVTLVPDGTNWVVV